MPSPPPVFSYHVQGSLGGIRDEIERARFTIEDKCSLTESNELSDHLVSPGGHPNLPTFLDEMLARHQEDVTRRHTKDIPRYREEYVRLVVYASLCMWNVSLLFRQIELS